MQFYQPTVVNGVSGAAFVSTAPGQTCLVSESGGASCQGAVGVDGLSSEVRHATTLPLPGVSVAEGVSIKSVEARADRSVCVLMTDGTPWCAGQNDAGQLGNGSTEASGQFVKVMGLTDVEQMDGDFSHACAVVKGGSVSCWGSNDRSQVGQSRGAFYHVPQVIVWD